MGRLTDEKLLLVHGMKDNQVDVTQSWTLAQALISRGILFTQMVRFFVKPQSRLGHRSMGTEIDQFLE